MSSVKNHSVFFLLLSGLLSAPGSGGDLRAGAVNVDSLPVILATNQADLVESRLRNQAVLQYGSLQLPENASQWETYRAQLKKKIIEKSGVVVDHRLPLDIRETGSTQMQGYQVKNIAFQARPGVYATANLYVPEGKGPFPAVITMHGHWPAGRLYESFQAIGQSLALNGYVCLNIDAYGAGERTTVSGTDEYHGANLGASLMNIGETLAGCQVTDNMRGVDLLCSLPYVDATNIGATGASGGGNQTMWLTALDERVKAAVPVVSVGTFESYIMRSNCVCELLPDGFTFTEEAGVIALTAPRAIKLCNNVVDNPTFLASEMLRTYANARPVFKMLQVENNISNLVLNKTHGYWPENREVMLGWFDLHLKGIGDGAPKKEIPFEKMTNNQLLVYPAGNRDPGVEGIAAYCKRKGNELHAAFVHQRNFDAATKKKELRGILRINDSSVLKSVHTYSSRAGWDRLALETTDQKLIPVLHRAPKVKSAGYVIVCDPKGKNHLPEALLEDYEKKGLGIVVVDLYGTGEASSRKENMLDKSMVLHTLSRSELWLGRTILGEWVKELDVVASFLQSTYHAQKIGIYGNREAALAAIFSTALGGAASYLELRDLPLSYVFDNRDSVDYFSMAVHLPGILKWGDVSLAAALGGKKITVTNPVTMSGRTLDGTNLKQYQTEFESFRKYLKQPEQTVFN